MRILILSFFDKIDSGGGQSRVAFELYEELVKKGIEAAILCPGKETLDFIDSDGVRKITIKSAGPNNTAFGNLIKRNVKELNHLIDNFSPDLLHSHTITFIGLLGQNWAKKNNKPFLYTAHEILSKTAEFITPGFSISKSLSNRVIKLIVKDFITNCDYIIALNKHIVQDLKMFEFKNGIFEISNGRNLEDYSNIPFTDYTLNKKKLIFIGHIIRRKNQIFLIKMMSYLSDDYELILIGNTKLEPLYFKKCEELIKKKDLNNIKFVGLVPHSQIRDYLESSHLFISASITEVQSLAVIEALAAGKPIIGISNETIDDLVSDKNGIVLSKLTSPKDFALEVEKLMQNNLKEYLQFSKNSKIESKKFDLDNSINKTIQTYESILKEFNSISKQDKEINSNNILDGRKDTSKNNKSRINIPTKTNLILASTIAVSILGYIGFKLIKGNKIENK